jgi:hypothetical protein
LSSTSERFRGGLSGMGKSSGAITRIWMVLVPSLRYSRVLFSGRTSMSSADPAARTGERMTATDSMNSKVK